MEVEAGWVRLTVCFLSSTDPGPVESTVATRIPALFEGWGDKDPVMVCLSLLLEVC